MVLYEPTTGAVVSWVDQEPPKNKQGSWDKLESFTH